MTQKIQSGMDLIEQFGNAFKCEYRNEKSLWAPGM